MSALNLSRWQFIIAGCPQRDPNLVMSLICLTSHALSAKSTLLPLTQTHSWFICASYPVYVIHHAIGLFSPPSPLCGVSGTEVILYSSESKHCPRCGAFKLFCFFSKLYACECSSGDPHTPSLLTAPPMIFHFWPLSSIQHGKIPQGWRREGGPTNQEFGQ